MRVLITGGAGFIGSHLAEALLDRGHHVWVLDDLSTGRVENIGHLAVETRFTYTIGSVTNEKMVDALMDQCDMVFHLAAVGTGLMIGTPVDTIETNVRGTETVLRQAAKQGKLVVVASTSAVYGKGAALPFCEDADLVLGAPTKSCWGYAASKLIDEFLAMAYWKERGAPVIVVRLFNTVGPRQSDRSDMVIPNFVRQALAGQPLIVHGDGSQTRSFTWVGDVVSGLIALAEEPRSVGEVFNIGNGAEISIRDLAGKITSLVDSDSAIQFVSHDKVFGQRFEDMSRRVPDITKIRRLVGYRPTVQLDEILERVIAYWRTRPALVARAPRIGADRPQPAVAHATDVSTGWAWAGLSRSA